MSLQEIIQEVPTLTIEERKQLVMVIIDSLASEKKRKRSVLEYRGVGEHLRDMDAQEYINQLRSEWDDRLK